MNPSAAFFLLGWALAMTLALLFFSGARGPSPPAPVVLETRTDPAPGGCSPILLFIAATLFLFFVWLLNS